MSGKPSRSDYKPSEAEKTNASVALANYRAFKTRYDPLLQKMRDESQSDAATRTLRNRANAETMQALTSQPTLRGATDVGAAGALTQGMQSQLGQATARGKQIQNQMQTNVLGTARGQAADAQSGLAQAARMGRSDVLEKAANRQAVARAKYQAGEQLAGTFLGQGLSNLGTSGQDPYTKTKVQGSFFTPVNAQGQRMTSPRQRAKQAFGFGGY
tara:strand:- start:9064 stop:9705 length:642 start_codon:yes stop_codon:yes gene_type:complete